ncbi:hypothetical protein T492DRAFT_6727 [Pavlovales sp. CCMP2436]|nr:hypothetical protein T492DRAFT_6727 [Pavlovales sp. CCMP2436]
MAAPVARADEPPQTMRDALLSAIPRMLFLYAALTAYKGFASGNRAAVRNAATTSVGATLDGPVVNAFSDTPIELRVYLSDHEAFSAFDDPAALVWTQPLDLRHSTQSPALNHTPHASGALLRNESSAWAHIYLTRAGFSPDPLSERPASFGTAISVARHHRLVAYKRAAEAPVATRRRGGSGRRSERRRGRRERGGGGANAGLEADTLHRRLYRHLGFPYPLIPARRAARPPRDRRAWSLGRGLGAAGWREWRRGGRPRAEHHCAEHGLHAASVRE